ncbi:general transcription factor II-I repeat domain-containing protein 2A-like [Oratosquilla oratoria]|uniref:general transcription factor II-I repeat domain-containing protein 2A-like n=1 Tax=Oratosquilla oratoria TaxID=337810 RepID=UPI003F762681
MGVDWMKTVSLATDGAPQMVGRKAGVATKLKEKTTNCKLRPSNLQYSLHSSERSVLLCSKILDMDHIMDIAIKAVNFIRAQGLNHRQFNSLYEDIHTHPQALP